MNDLYDKYFSMRSAGLEQEDMQEIKNIHDKMTEKKYPHAIITPEVCAISGNEPAIMTLLSCFMQQFAEQLKQNHPEMEPKKLLQECLDIACMSNKEMLQQIIDILKTEKEEV